MTFRDASKEFELDCKVRHLSPKTLGNYTKQLRYLENYLSSEFSVLNIEDVKPAHIKSFMSKMDDAGRKPQYGKPGSPQKCDSKSNEGSVAFLKSKKECACNLAHSFFAFGVDSKEGRQPFLAGRIQRNQRFRGRESNGDSVPLAHDFACKV